MPGRETRHRWEDKGGQVKVTLLPKKKKRLNSRLLYLLSVEINKVLALQICWYGGLDDMTKGWVGRETGRTPAPAGRPGGLPSVVLPSATARHAIHGARSPRPAESRTSFALSERALRRGRGRGAVLGSHGLGAQHWRLQWLERLKLQSTARG